MNGVVAVVDIVQAALDDRISLNLGVVALFAGIGLLRLSPGWRTCAIVLLWLGMILIPIIALLPVIFGGPITADIFGRKYEDVRIEIWLTVVVAIFLLLLWQYRVLHRPDVLVLFGLKAPRPAADVFD